MPDRHGPYRRMRFLLEIDGIAKAGFARCRVADRRTDVTEYREGNDPPTPRKLWGLNRYGPLVLESGVTDDSIALSEWRDQVEQGDVDGARGPIAVIVLDEEGEIGPRWEFAKAWPVRYDGPRLDANRDGVAIERLVIEHEGMERIARRGDGAGTPGRGVKGHERESETEAESTDGPESGRPGRTKKSPGPRTKPETDPRAHKRGPPDGPERSK